jgi:acyl-CoA reductase-like NAD-dependent aldehyde dehydrogenase
MRIWYHIVSSNSQLSSLDVYLLTSLNFAAASWAALGICYNSGQDCTAGSRVYVQDSIYDKFLKLLVSKAKSQIIGDGFDENSSGGPVVRWCFCR